MTEQIDSQPNEVEEAVEQINRLALQETQLNETLQDEATKREKRTVSLKLLLPTSTTSLPLHV